MARRVGRWADGHTDGEITVGKGTDELTLSRTKRWVSSTFMEGSRLPRDGCRTHPKLI